MTCEGLRIFKIGGLWNFSVQKLVVGWSNLFLIVYLNAYSSLTRLQPEFDHIRSISNSQCCQNQPPLVWCGHSFQIRLLRVESLAISWMFVFRIYVFKTQQPSDWLVISIHMINYIPRSLQIYQKTNNRAPPAKAKVFIHHLLLCSTKTPGPILNHLQINHSTIL